MAGFAIEPMVVVLVVAKVSLILGVALGVDRWMRHGWLRLGWFRSGATALARHRLWIATIVLALLVPWFGSAIPAWHVLPSVLHSASPTSEPQAPTSAVETSGSTGLGATIRDVASEHHAIGIESTVREDAEVAMMVTETHAIVGQAGDAGGGNSLAPLLPVALLLLVGLWGVGVVVGGLRLAKALAREHRWARNAAPMSLEWREQGHSLARRLGVQRAIRFGECAEIETPVTGGALRPTVLLPPAARDWTPTRRQVVLAHELVHVRRFDALWLLGGRVLACLFWFHPLVHRAMARAHEAREQACDEAVLGLGTRASDYASHLLAIASAVAGPRPATLLAMAHGGTRSSSQLERRLTMILDASRPRRSSTLTVAAVSTLMLAGTAVASIMPTPPAAPTAPAAPMPVAAAPMPVPVPGPAPAPGPVAAYRPGHAPTPPPAPMAPAPISASSPSPPSPPSPGAPAAPPSAPSPPRPASYSWNGSDFDCDRLPAGGTVGMSWSSHYDGDDVGSRRQMATFRVRDDLGLCYESRGDVEIADDGSLRIGQGGNAELRTRGRGRDLRLEASLGADGRTIHRFEVDGETRAFDARAERWLRASLVMIKNRRAIGALHGRAGAMRGEIGALRGERGAMRGRIGSIRGQEGALRGEIGALRGEVAAGRGRIAQRRGEVAALRGSRMHADDARRREIDRRIETVEDEIVGLERDERDRRDEIERRIDRVEAEIAYIDRGRIAEVEAEIAQHDTDGRVAVIEARIADLDLDRRVAAYEAASDEAADRLESLIRELR